MEVKTSRGICLLFVLAIVSSAAGQAPLSTSAAEPYRFMAAHGERSAVFDYAGRGLEIWGYPFQILDHYAVDFRPAGSPAILHGPDLLTRVEVAPDSVTRMWTGPGFQVTEDIFVPLDQPAAILRYQLTGRTSVDLVIRFRPVLNLMWPAAVGGQDVGWDDAVHGYVLSESSDHYGAVVASPQITKHAGIVNSAHREDLTQTFTLHPVQQEPGRAQATIDVVLLAPGDKDPQNAIRQLMVREAALRAAAAEHLRQWQAESLTITTPDAKINRALRWAETDLEQAWACDARIGCGVVAGYGASRPERRPQYDWFFAGDGMVAVEAMLASGHFERARQELEFILRYQNRANGMIWHEISQSAGFLDWAGHYPYLYPHVDTSLQFLSTLRDYSTATGDRQFLANHWTQIAAAFHFCESLLDPATGLPVIPSNKMGADEQDRMHDDAGLSAAWVDAAAAYAEVARATGHPQDADAALAMGRRARSAYAPRYWDLADRFWISGYTVGGRAMNVRRSGPSAAITEHLLPPAQEAAILDTLAGAAFQTDWGTRSLATDSPDYDPDSYAKGSVSALHTADMAQAFWNAHRPVTAWQLWSGLIPWEDLDSPGHMEEVLTGNVFAPQVESVPEQTWSSAGFLSAAIHGLLGISSRASEQSITLAPHPILAHGSESRTLVFTNLHAAGAVLAAKIVTSLQGIDVTLTNDGSPIALTLAPEIPLGASRVRAEINGKPASASIRTWPGEQQATLKLQLPRGVTHCRYTFSGGVWIDVPPAQPHPGAASRMPKVRDVTLQGQDLQIRMDTFTGQQSSLILKTPWRIAAVHGGTAQPLSGSRTKIVVTPTETAGAPSRFVTTILRVQFDENGKGGAL